MVVVSSIIRYYCETRLALSRAARVGRPPLPLPLPLFAHCSKTSRISQKKKRTVPPRGATVIKTAFYSTCMSYSSSRLGIPRELEQQLKDRVCNRQCHGNRNGSTHHAPKGCPGRPPCDTISLHRSQTVPLHYHNGMLRQVGTGPKHDLFSHSS